MSNQSNVPPVVGIVIGEPCGIGPEVVAKSWANRSVHELCRPILIGSARAMEQAVEIAGTGARVEGAPITG